MKYSTMNQVRQYPEPTPKAFERGMKSLHNEKHTIIINIEKRCCLFVIEFIARLITGESKLNPKYAEINQ